jgi:hypothetical protein
MLRNLPKIIVPISNFQGVDAPLTGVITIAGKQISGLNTLFVDEIVPGAELIVNSRIVGVISKIQSDTVCFLEEETEEYTGEAIIRNFQTIEDASPVVMSDILFRIKVNRDAIRKSSFLMPYTITENETPEMVSYNFYGTPLYHWVILLINEIVDPREEWPINERQMLKKIALQYSVLVTGTVSTIKDSDIVTGTETNFLDELKVGDFLYKNSNTEHLGRIDAVISNTSLRLTKSSDITYQGVMKKCDFNQVYEYREIEYGYVVDFDAQLIALEQIYPVTIYEYENEKNEEKRFIRVLDPNFITEFVTEFNRAYTEIT